MLRLAKQGRNHDYAFSSDARLYDNIDFFERLSGISFLFAGLLFFRCISLFFIMPYKHVSPTPVY